ncbi:MAG TPA: hypothetical protein VGB17_01785 [Pyrinomonadaceae bacterium]
MKNLTRIILSLLLVMAILMPSKTQAQAEKTFAAGTETRKTGPERTGPESTVAARHIIICLDGVGISTINRMRAEGRFKMFRRPSYMISTFPSLTNLAMSEILEPAGARHTAGYEDNYFDLDQNRMRGGVFDRLRSSSFIRGTFRELFDYHPSAIKSGLGYAAPPLTTYLEALSDLLRLRQKAKQTRQPVFLAYTGATDSLAHLGGERMLRSFLKQLDETVKEIVRESAGPVTLTIFSDHGNHFRKYRRVAIKSPLGRAGFKLEQRIKDERSVVLPQFGLVGSAVLYTNEANERRLAETLAGIAGVDFATYEKGGVVYLIGPEGEATIEKRVERYRYKTLKGDPLALLPIMQSLSASGKMDADGFIADADWFAATRDGARPDAVRRIFLGTSAGVGNRASVIVNLLDGYYTGSSMLDVFAFLQATHGNLGQDQSYGFVMSTSLNLPLYIRAADVWKAMGHPQLRKGISQKMNAAAQ